MSVIFGQQLETRVEMVDGMLRISQPDHGDPDGRDDVILIAAENVDLFVAYIRELVAQIPSSKGHAS